MKPCRNPFRLPLATSIAVLLATYCASAADQTWLDGGPTNDWNLTDLNWDAGAVWTNDNTATFGGTGEAIALSTGITSGGLTFNSTDYSVTGNSLGLIGATPAISVTTAGHTATITSGLTGTTGLTKSGAGVLVLSGTNTGYSGGTTLSGGTLSIGGSANLGTGAVTFSGGNLTVTNNNQTLAQALTLTSAALLTTPSASSTTTFSGKISGAGALSVTGSGALVFSNTTNDYSGGLTLNNAVRLQILANGAALGTGTVTVNGTSTPTSGTGSQMYASGAVTLTNNFNISGSGGNSADAVQRGALRLDSGATVSGNIALTANAAIGSFTGGGTVSGIISGTGFALTKVEANTLTLSNNNTFTGGTTVHAGTLTLGGAAGTGTGRIRGTVTVNSGTTLNLTASNALGYFASSKVDTVNLSGTLNNTAVGDNGWGVTYNLTGGTLQSNGGTSNAAATQLFSFGGNPSGTGTAVNTLASATTSTIAGRIHIRENNPGNAVAFDVADGAAVTDLLVSAAITEGAGGRGITKNGAGLMSLTGAASFTGATTVNGGTLHLSGTLPSSAITVNDTASFISPAVGKTFAAITANNGSTLGLSAQTGATTTVTGALTLTTGGNVAIALQSIDAASQTLGTVYDLVTAGSISGTGTTTLSPNTPFGPTRVTGITSVSGNKLQLTVTGAGANLIWNNAAAGGVDTGTWDLNTTANFNNGGSDDVFKVADVVTFNDSLLSGSPKTVNLAGTLAPALVTVNNSAGDYTLTSTGSLVGGGSLVKSGTSQLTLTANHTYAGTTTVNGGTLQVGTTAIGTTGSLGTGAVSIASGATVNIRRSDNTTFANSFSGSGNLTFNGTNNGSGENGTSSYVVTGNNSGFSGTITPVASRFTMDAATDVGSATLVSGTNGQFFITAGTYTNNFTIAGDGWGEAAGQLGAIRLSGSTLSGTITLAANSRISTHGGTGVISGPIVGSGFGLTFGTLDPSSAQTTTLTLSGASTYTGATTIGHNATSVANITLSGSLGATAVTVVGNSRLNGKGTIGAGGSLTFDTGTTTFGYDGATAGAMNVGGNLALNGTTAVNLTPGPAVIPGTPLTILTYTGSVTGTSANLTLANAASFRQANFTVGGGAVTLDFGAKALTWTGAGGLNWNINTTANFNDTTPAASTFYTGDTVTFNDSAGAANGVVTLVGTLMPSSLVINNTATVPYTFTGAGNIGGATSLVKQGVGTLTITAPMSYTGGTQVDAGSIIVDSNNVQNRLPNGSSLVINNSGTFEVRGVNALPSASNAISATVNAGATLRFVSGASAATSASIQSHCHMNNLTLNGGTVDLTYSGTGVVYSTESFQVIGNVTVGGLAASTIQSSAAVAVQGMALVGNRTFAVADVTASAATDLTITAELENSDSNNGAVTKTGAGTLSLNAANSYTAGTTVSAGTLLLGNGGTGSATGTGAVNVASGATLAGDGTVSGAVTAAGTLSPGSSIGTLTLGSTTLTGSYACEIDGTSRDLLTINGDVNLTGATLAVSPIGAGLNQASNVIGTWTGTRTGAFAGVTGAPGYAVTYDDTNKQILLVASNGYSSWVSNYPGLADTTPGGDSDMDGIPNLLEYTLGGSPLVSNTGILPTQLLTATTLEFSFKRSDSSETDTVQVVQWGNDLVGWTDISVNPTPAGNVTITENGAADDDVKVVIQRNANTKLFARLKVIK